MTSPTDPSVPSPAAPPGCPAHQEAGQGEPLYGPEFAAEPQAVYERLRKLGPFAAVELAPGVGATLVTDIEAALHVLRSPETFSKDPRRWRALKEGRLAPDCPVLPMMEYRPNVLFADGENHRRQREAVSDGLARVDPMALRAYVENSADVLIDRFAPTGEADLLGEYAQVLPLLVFNQLFGCPPEQGDRLVEGMASIFDGVDAAAGNALVAETTSELIALKRQKPGPDITSWLIAHPAGLTDEEMIHQIIVLVGAGTEPQQNLITNSLRLLLSDDRFSGSLSGGNLPVEDALDEVLWTDPPLANYGVHYPIRDVEYEGTTLHEGEPLVISFAAANTGPAIAADQRAGNRAHLAWSAGPHSCPAQGPARLIAAVAVEKLLDRLPDMELAVPAEELQWRPGPFHRALTSLPVRFPKTPVPVEREDDVPGSTSGAGLTAGSGRGTTPAGGPGELQRPSVPQPRRSSPASVPAPRGGGRRNLWSSLRSWWRGVE